MRQVLLWVSLLSSASAQQYTISTVAGIGRLPFSGGGSPAVNAVLVQPRFVAADPAGNVFVSDSYYHQVFRVAADGGISVYAGTGQPGFGGDGGTATAAQLNTPLGLAVDASGNLYIADNGNSRIRKVTPGGMIATVAGNGQGGVTGDGGSATAAGLGGPFGLAVDGAGNLYVSESFANIVRMIDSKGNISTIAGTGQPGYSGDGAKATAAQLFQPQGLKPDAAGNLYVADAYNNRIRKITPQGAISTFAGTGQPGLSGDLGQAGAAQLFQPADVAIDNAGNVYIADTLNSRIRVVKTSGVIQELAGGGSSFADGPGNQADLPNPYGLSLDNNGNIVAAIRTGRQVRKVTPQGAVTTVAGALPNSAAGENMPATSAPIFDPTGVAVDSAGNVYVSDSIDNRVRKVLTSGNIVTVAGNGLIGTTGDNGPATQARAGVPQGLALDSQGNLYLTSLTPSLVRRVATNGVITTVAGSTTGYSGDGGKALSAQLFEPSDILVDTAGNLYIADTTNQRVRRVDSTSQIINTIAGTGVPGYSGDGAQAALAQLYQPRGMTLDSNGNLYIADTSNNRVRRITPAGVIATVAGTGVGGGAGDGGQATAAQLSGPTSVAIDAAGNLYIAAGARIRKVAAATGIISTIAGTGTAGFSGDGGPATSANIDQPRGLVIDGAGNLYFADEVNLRVRKLTPVQAPPAGVPTISPGGVITAAAFGGFPAFAPGSWIEIYGSNLASNTRQWAGSDFTGVNAPTTLDGVKVTMDGQAAFIDYISPTQINAQVPSGVATDFGSLVVTNASGSTGPYSLNFVELVVPGLLAPPAFNINGQQYAAALFTDGVTYVLPPGAIPGLPSRQARPGETIVLYGVGFGPVTPNIPAGQIVTQSNQLSLPFTMSLGGAQATLTYFGLAPGNVGLYQFNVVVPQIADSDTVPLTFTVAGSPGPQMLVTAVRQ